MDSLAKLQHCYQPLHLSLNHHRPSFPKLTSSLSFPTAPFNLLSVRASSSADPPHHNPKSPKPSILQSVFFPALTSTCVTLAAAAALFFMRIRLKPSITTPIVESAVEPIEESIDVASYEEREGAISEQLSQNPNDIEALRSLVELRIKAGKHDKAIETVDRLMELEPDEYDWLLLKANIHSDNEEEILAKEELEGLLVKDPLRIEAYQGLAMLSESENVLEDLVKKIEVAVERLKGEEEEEEKDNSKNLRDFKLLIAQIKFMKGYFDDALRVYQEVATEEPRDFRPYLCQGILYALLKKKDEAMKQFDKFRELVPEGHPYANGDVNTILTKLCSDLGPRFKSVE